MALTLPAPLPVSFSTSSSTTNPNVPEIYDVAIDGVGFMLDWSKYQSRTLPSTRDTFDLGAEAGENSFNTEGFWTRTQQRFDFGAGQQNFDQEASPRRRFSEEDFSDRRRFQSSKGVNVWDEQALKLLNDVSTGPASANTGLQLLSVGGFIVQADGTNFHWKAGVIEDATWDNTVAAGGTILSMTTDGYTVWMSVSGVGIRSFVAGTWTVGTLSAVTADLVEYANGRLIGADGNEIFELDSAGAKTTIWTNTLVPNGTFVALATTSNAFYAAYQSGDLASFYAFQPDTVAATIAPPVFAGSLPRGETVHALEAYSTILMVGTSQGLRVAEWSSTNTALDIQKAVTIGTDVKCMVGYGKYIYFGWTNYDSFSTGLGRLDLSRTTSVYGVVPPYASDLMATTQGIVTSIAIINGQAAFCVDEVGYFHEDLTAKVATGELLSGNIDYGTSRNKLFSQVEIGHSSSNGFLSAALVVDGTDTSIGSGVELVDHTHTTQMTADLIHPQASLRITLTRSAVTSIGPEVDFWSVSAIPLPGRVDEIVVPIILRTEVEDNTGRRLDYNTLNIRRWLEGLIHEGFVVYQEADWSRLVHVSQVIYAAGEAEGLTPYPTHDQNWIQGLIYVRLLTKET